MTSPQITSDHITSMFHLHSPMSEPIFHISTNAFSLFFPPLIYIDQTVEPVQKVYGCPHSIGTMRVLASIYEHEVDFDFISIDINSGEHRKESFIAINVCN
ncbi:hypothetical protein FRX31_009583 [Thalictrum thalictroides]|uniref:Uncharacterized protein n=1 Tax=Thalictrum thalictroides TaxID=46969 RepID=A0A7J6WTW8_THATH|nr:hypothetical protein FRX31_009583 [Thalictrum thalictroides]